MRNYTKYFTAYLLQLLLVMGTGLYLGFFGHWQIQTNILALLPESSSSQSRDEAITQKAEQSLFAGVEKKVLIALSGKDALSAYPALVEKLTQLPYISLDHTRIPTLNEISQFYAPYKDNLLSPQYLHSLSDEQAIQALMLGQLTQMANPFVSETLEISPRLNLADYLNVAMNRLLDGKKQQDIVSVTSANEIFYLMTLKVNADSFSVNDSQLIATQLQEQLKQFTDSHQVNVIYSGVLFHTAESSKQAQWEISTFGLLSVIGVILLVIFIFRSLIPLNFALVVLAIAVFYGFTGMLIFFKQLHLLTLVFAVTLIGVVIDYCFHAFVTIEKSNDLQPILKPLLLGFLTTVLGYSALLFSPMALLSQVAVFIIFGLFGALTFVLMCLPKFNYRKTITVNRGVLVGSQVIADFFQRVSRYKIVIYSGLTLALVISLSVEKISFNDDVRLLNSSPSWLITNEVKMAKIFDYQHHQRIVLHADNVQALLEKQEQVIAQLHKNQQGLNIKSVADLLPSIELQQHNYQLLRQAQQNGIFERGLSLTGLSDPIHDFTPLTFAQFKKGPLGPLSELYLSTYEQPTNKQSTNKQSTHKQGFVLWLDVSVKPIVDELSQGKLAINEKNITWLNAQDDVDLYNRAEDVSSVLSSYRQGLFDLLALAFLIVAVVLFIRYGLKKGLLGLLPILFSAFGALVLSQWLLGHLNIFNLLAVLLILALAIDYVIFYQEQGVQVRTLLAITLSAISSALVFGILVFSVTPAVQSFGLTVMLGIVFIFVLSPLSTYGKSTSKQSTSKQSTSKRSTYKQSTEK